MGAKQMKSIGDFAINIIPDIDTIKLYSGITALHSLGQIADSIFDKFKSAYNVVDDTAESLRDLAYAGKELDIPVQQIKIMENTMKLFGLNSEQAVEALKSMSKFTSGAIFGEIPEDLILKAGLVPSMFGKDWQENMKLLSRVYQANTNRTSRESLNQIFGSGVERMLTDPQRLRDYIEQATQLTAKISPSDLAAAEKYQADQAKLAISMDNLAIAMNRAAMPGLTKAIESFTTVMKDPKVKKFFEGAGSVLSYAGTTIGENITEPPLELIPNMLKRAFGLSKDQSLLIEFLKFNFDLKANAVNAKQFAQEYFHITNISDGTSIDTKIETKNKVNQKNNIQNNQNTTRVK
jgi:hypothetical protein